MSQLSRLSRGNVAVRLILTAVFFLCATGLWLNQQYVVDQISVWQYKPTSEVALLASRASMSDRGTFLYYASQPEIEGSQRFNQACDRKEEGTAVLGCYNGSKIFIFDVKDPRLSGIREVTAAHEMLHAAYQRLSGDERAKIDALVEAEYSKLENTADYKERMAFYARNEPGERDNELHSVIGTEIKSISPELEAHYKAYFSDRSKVVALHQAYQEVFNKLEADAKALFGELEQLSKAIGDTTSRYNTDVNVLNRDIQQFNVKATDGTFTSQAQFAAERSSLVSRANALGGLRDKINDDISAYEAKRKAYNQIASESKQLVDSLNSSLAPKPEI